MVIFNLKGNETLVTVLTTFLICPAAPLTLLSPAHHLPAKNKQTTWQQNVIVSM